MKKLTLSVLSVVAICTFVSADGYKKMAKLETESITPVDNGFYIGLAYGAGRLKEDLSAHTDYSIYNSIQKINYDNIMLQAGYKFSKYLSLEGRYWKSFGDNGWSYTESGRYEGKPYDYSDAGANGDNMKAWGIYAKPMYPVTEKTDIYALLGYGNITLNDDDSGNWLDEDGFQWGIGASYAFEEKFSLFVDYVKLVDKDYSRHMGTQIGGSRYNWNDTLYTVNIGLTYRF